MAKMVMQMVSLPDVTLALAGTRQRLNVASLEVDNITIQWHPGNTGDIYIGDSSVAAGRGFLLSASNPILSITTDDTQADEDIVVMDLRDIWIDGSVNNDKVKLGYMVLASKTY